MDTTGVIQLIVLVFLIALSAFFSSAETALTTVNRVKIRSMEENGVKRAKTVGKILDNYGNMLSAILIGNNIVNISASSLTTTLVIRIWGNVYVGLSTGILTIVLLLLGEIIPKRLASLYAEKMSLTYCHVIYVLIKLLTPAIFIITALANGIMKLMHIDPNKRLDTITESELKTYVDVSHEDGEIESKERELIYNVFEFTDTVAKDIMIPSVNMVTVNTSCTYDELEAVFKDSLYTRIPVYLEEKDSMIGFVNIKDFFLCKREEFDINKLIRNAYYTYEYKKTADLLLEMREKSKNVAFVLNEYGSTAGMITLEDLIEELVGEIRDEYDEDETKLIHQLDEQTYLVEASINLDDLNEVLHTDLSSEDNDSIGGLLMETLSRLPEDDESVTLENGISLQVKGIDQNHIEKVLVILPKIQQ